MRLLQNNHAYIDAANLHRGVKSLGWELDYAKLLVWLKEKCSVTYAYLFMGYIPEKQDLYASLKEIGYSLVFKETTMGSDHRLKGNCDADLVLRAVCDTYEDEYDEAVIISSDGDYASLIRFLNDRKRLHLVISPSNKCSFLIKRLNIPLEYLRSIKEVVEKS